MTGSVHERGTAGARIALLLGLALGGCATLVNGTTQEVTIETRPDRATCKVEHQGGALATVDSTPGKVLLPRQSEVLTVTCTRSGFEPAQEALVPTFSNATFGNLLLGGMVGAVIDSSSGANYLYPDRLTLVLAPSS